MLSSVVLITFTTRAQQSESIKMGDVVPNSELGTDFRTGNIVQLEDYKDKIVILDFWNSYCSSCIAGFPFLEKLQHQFPDDIQILLVNGEEDSTALTKSMQRRVFQNWSLPDLPIVVDARKAKELFPYRGVPHHVWLGKDSRVILMGAAANTNASKVETVLAGKPFFILNNLNTAKPLPDDYSLEEYAIVESLLYRNGIQSVMAGFQNDYSPQSSRRIEKPENDGEFKNRVTYLNYEVAELFKEVYADYMDKQHSSVIYSGEFSYGTVRWWANYIQIHDIDTLLITSAFSGGPRLTDSAHIKSRFSYEQLTPNESKGSHNDYMLQALNDYFETKLGIKVSLVRENTSAYVMKGGMIDLPKVEDGYALKDQLGAGIRKLMEARSPNDRRFVIDRTGIEKLPRIGLREGYTWEQMEERLKEYGITVAEQIIPFYFLRFAKSY